jgi:hypothetical protein
LNIIRMAALVITLIIGRTCHGTHMSRFTTILAAAALSTVAIMNTAAFAQEGGPCTDDIAKLKRELG